MIPLSGPSWADAGWAEMGSWYPWKSVHRSSETSTTGVTGELGRAAGGGTDGGRLMRPRAWLPSGITAITMPVAPLAMNGRGACNRYPFVSIKDEPGCGGQRREAGPG